jgi:DNA-binding MarR family transcriptional regulator
MAGGGVAGRNARTDGLTTADYRTLAELRYLLRRFAAFSEAAARRAGLTSQQHQALLAIKGFPGRERLAVGELAERLQLRHHSAVGLVDRLAARGLLVRRLDRGDRRRVMVELTARSQALLATLTRVHREELRRLAPLLRALLRRLAQQAPRARPRSDRGGSR